MLGIVGLLTRDVVDGEEPRVGGAPYYCGRALAAIGRPGVVITKYNSADAALARPLHELGVPVIWRDATETTSFHLRYVQDRRVATIDALGEAWTPADVAEWISEALGGVDWVHAGALSRADFPPATLSALSANRLLCFDGQGLVRPGRTGEVVRDSAFDESMLRHVDILKLSEAEAASLGIAPERLPVPEVIVTHGAGGASVYAGRRREFVGTNELDVRDPTGAGDAFITAYLLARSDGAVPVEAARTANRRTGELLEAWQDR